MTAPRQTPRDFSVGIVGAGFGGLGTAIQLQRAGIRNFRIFERGDSVGGVWRANTYPGAACDVPSHLYSFSFAPGSDWSKRYAPQPDILAYLKGLTDEYDLHDRLQLNTAVQSARFDAVSALWQLETDDGQQHQFDLLVTACGQLTNPVIPKLDGREQFGGPAFHSADWDHGLDLSGKRVAVIGTGASAIQFVPVIARQAAQLDIYQRSAPWILPKMDRDYPQWEQKFFRNFPARVAVARKTLFGVFEALTYGFTGSNWVMKPATALANSYRRKALKGRPELLEKCTPDYAIGCKRVLFTSDWYSSLCRENVALHTGGVAALTETGVRDAGGEERPADVVIWGTGFSSGDFVAPMQTYGLNGQELNEAWAGRPEAYLGTTVAGFPNLFILYGPNTNHGSGSVPYTHECQISYLLDGIRQLREGGYRYLDLNPAAQQRWRQEMAERSKNTVWLSGGCSSWYTNTDGLNTNNWPGPWLEYKRRTAKLDAADYAFTA